MRKSLTPLLLIALLVSSSLFVVPVGAEDDESYEQTAEVAINLADDYIPSIKKEWTTINLTVQDVFGLNWDYLQDAFPVWYMKIVWPYMFGIKEIDRFLGYTSLSFFPIVESSDPDGWSAKITPASIDSTTQGRNHTIVLQVKANELANDYNPTVVIECKRYDAIGEYYGSTYATIPVKAESLNFALVDVVEATKQASPKSLVDFEMIITNQGEYKDTYYVDVTDENGTKGIVSQQVLVLNPGEATSVTITYLTPEVLFDPGTPRRLNISVYPVENPDAEFNLDVIVITQGMYISPLAFIVLGAIIVLLIIVYVVVRLLLAKFNKDLYERLFGPKTKVKGGKIEVVKPEKPWKISSEQKHLETLKAKDKKKYEAELTMMEQEYQSAVLWYDHYVQALKIKASEDLKKAKLEAKKKKAKLNDERKKKKSLAASKAKKEKTETKTVVKKEESKKPAKAATKESGAKNASKAKKEPKKKSLQKKPKAAEKPKEPVVVQPVKSSKNDALERIRRQQNK